MELWDAYNPDGTLAGIDLIRGEEIPKDLRHAVAEVFVMHSDGSILLMQRDYNKPYCPGYWESGASGAVLKGESFIEGAKRELYEETGIIADDLKFNYKYSTDKAIYQGFFYITDILKNKICLQDKETIAYRWVSKKEFLEVFNSDIFVPLLRDRLRKFVNNDFNILN